MTLDDEDNDENDDGDNDEEDDDEESAKNTTEIVSEKNLHMEKELTRTRAHRHT